MTDNALETVQRDLLDSAGVDQDELGRVLGRLMTRAVDDADLYFQHSRSESWTLEDGIVREAGHDVERGVGVRAVSGERTGFAYSDEIEPAALTSASDAARAIARQGSSGSVQAWRRQSQPALYRPVDPVQGLSSDDKVALLQRLDAVARAQDPRVKQVIVSLAAVQDQVLIASGDGTLAGDVRPLSRLNVTVIAEQDGRRERGTAGGGGRWSCERFDAESLGEHYAREAVRQALVNLEAVDAPAGSMPVVLGPGWPGILLHEAVGHGLEGDFNRKGSSAFSGRIGEKVASELCTVVDDATMEGRRGSLSLDDEGTPGSYTVLIENGVLTGYMQDKQNARLMGGQSTGNGRRESFAHLPMPRMTNTYMLNGPHDPDEIIASVDRGLYAVSFGGGQVDITSGKFVFSANEAYLIENGRITRPVKGATLIGNGPDVLTRVSMVGNDMALDSGIGVCGKEGQSVPVGVGQPTLKIDELTVGGTQG